MGHFSCYKHITTIPELLFFSRSIARRDDYPIPLNKILFTLYRRGFLSTILVESSPDNKQYSDECRGSEDDPRNLLRYHFFNASTSGTVATSAYGGYCDVRPDGSIADAFITLDTITNGGNDSYVYIPCRSEFSLVIPMPDESTLTHTIGGFPYLEKNHKETMCAQAALLGVVQYWKYKNSGCFAEIYTARDINRMAGVSEDRKGGLNAAEIKEFFKQVGHDVIILDYSMLIFGETERLHLSTDVYSFIESSCPVVAAVKTYNGGHALTFIGHTFDKNSWSAMADPGYFGKMNAFFHENTSWIENLIIQDDNFGPYYFFPLHRLPKIINCAIIPVPSPNIKILPHEAANIAVRKTLYSNEFGEFLKVELESNPMLGSNLHWFDEFRRHLNPTCGDGLVPRTILQTGADVIVGYESHEFSYVVKALLDHHDLRGNYFWAVELSWPSIYCFGQSKSGTILVDTHTAEISFVHIPGVCIAFSGSQDERVPFVFIAKEEDAPFTHCRPGVVNARR